MSDRRLNFHRYQLAERLTVTAQKYAGPLPSEAVHLLRQAARLFDLAGATDRAAICNRAAMALRELIGDVWRSRYSFRPTESTSSTKEII